MNFDLECFEVIEITEEEISFDFQEALLRLRQKKDTHILYNKEWDSFPELYVDSYLALSDDGNSLRPMNCILNILDFISVNWVLKERDDRTGKFNSFLDEEINTFIRGD